jgi:hypothetical protein
MGRALDEFRKASRVRDASSDGGRALWRIAGEASGRARDLPTRGELVDDGSNARRRDLTRRSSACRDDATEDAVCLVRTRTCRSPMGLDMGMRAARFRFDARIRNRRECGHQKLEQRGEYPAETIEARAYHPDRIIPSSARRRHVRMCGHAFTAHPTHGQAAHAPAHDDVCRRAALRRALVRSSDPTRFAAALPPGAAMTRSPPRTESRDRRRSLERRVRAERSRSA